MAIVKGALFSLKARGQLGETLNFQTPKKRNICTRYHKPGGSPSDLQVACRNIGKIAIGAVNVSLVTNSYIPPLWQRSFRIFRQRQTFFGGILSQYVKMQNIVLHGASARLVRVRMYWGNRFVDDTRIGSNVVRMVPLACYCYSQGTSAAVYQWRMWGFDYGLNQYRVQTARDLAGSPKTFDYAVFFFKMPNGEEIKILPICDPTISSPPSS